MLIKTNNINDFISMKLSWNTLKDFDYNPIFWDNAYDRLTRKPLQVLWPDEYIARGFGSRGTQESAIDETFLKTKVAVRCAIKY